MYKLADPFREYMDQDSAVLQALESTDRGLFDVDELARRGPRGAYDGPSRSGENRRERDRPHDGAMAVSSTAQARGGSNTGASSRAPRGLSRIAGSGAG